LLVEKRISFLETPARRTDQDRRRHVPPQTIDDYGFRAVRRVFFAVNNAKESTALINGALIDDFCRPRLSIER